MTEPRLTHTPISCKHCESLPPEVARRHWKGEPKARAWHIVADSPDLMTRVPPWAHFITILAYHHTSEGQRHYQGPLYLEGDAENPAKVLRDIQHCLQLLNVEYDCAPEMVRTWLSGGRSLHVTIHASVIGAEPGHPHLPQIYAAMIETLFPSRMAPTLDRGIYSGGMGRMWRLANRRRSDTGCYKVPVAIGEVLHGTYETIEPLTHQPRRGVFHLPEADLTPCPALVQLYQDTAAMIERQSAQAPVGHRSHTPIDGGEGLLFHAFNARGWLGHPIEGKGWAVVCPWDSAHTQGAPLDTSTILFAPSAGHSLGWFHCSHGHCYDRDIDDVLKIFSETELSRARNAAGIPPTSSRSTRSRLPRMHAPWFGLTVGRVRRVW
jgi:hypothetical protein